MDATFSDPLLLALWVMDFAERFGYRLLTIHSVSAGREPAT